MLPRAAINFQISLLNWAKAVYFVNDTILYGAWVPPFDLCWDTVLVKFATIAAWATALRDNKINKCAASLIMFYQCYCYMNAPGLKAREAHPSSARRQCGANEPLFTATRSQIHIIVTTNTRDNNDTFFKEKRKMCKVCI